MKNILILLLLLPVLCSANELSDTYCLAKNIYFEARSEATLGKVAVGLVVLNRVNHPSWSSDICSVVYDNKQFSWTIKLKPYNIKNIKAFRESWLIASALLHKEQKIIDFTKNSTHYHTLQISPYWKNYLEFTVQIGNHRFYK